jgi:UDP-glucose 4-epimerase
VYASSAAIYGDNASTPLTEGAAPRPLTAYGADKLGCELHARVAGLIHQVPTTGFRFFNVYGPRQDPHSPYSGVISIFAERILTGRPIIIFGDGQQVRDFIYVSDIVLFLLAGMKSASTSALVYNACTGNGTNIVQLARSLASVHGASADIKIAPARNGDIRISLGDPSLAYARLGVQANVTLGAGLRETLRFLISAEVAA